MESEPLLPSDNYSKHHHKEVRANFVRKVLGIVSMQVIFTVAAVYLIQISHLADIPEGTEIGRRHHRFEDLYGTRTFTLLMASMVAYLAIAITLFCCKRVARKVPTNYILLFLLTLCISYMLAFICQFYTEASIFKALVITILVTVGLTGFTIVYKPKMSLVIGCIVVVALGIIGVLMLFLFTWATGGNVAGILYLYYFLGVIFYGLFLVFDVLRLTKKKYGLSVDDYVFAALMIYLDIINLFLEILRLVGNRK
jgi:FtsH-binding integral membrane protein